MKEEIYPEELTFDPDSDEAGAVPLSKNDTPFWMDEEFDTDNPLNLLD